MKMRSLIRLKFPDHLVQEPVLGKAAKACDVLPSIIFASVNEKGGEIVLEIRDEPLKIVQAMEYLIKKGVKISFEEKSRAI